MAEEKTALVGLHRQPGSGILFMFFEEVLKTAGYSGITKANNLPEMREAMGLSDDSPRDAAPQNPFDAYIMDANLGSPGKDVYEPAQEIYGHVRPKVKEGEVKFVAVTGNVDLATRIENGANTDESLDFRCMTKPVLVQDLLTYLR